VPAPAARAPAAPPPAAPIVAAAPVASVNEEWYVGINGVPLGPVRVAVIRDKALAGLVDGESLVWRDGLGEWKALKHFPELLEVITSAQAAVTAAAPAPAPPPPAAPAPVHAPTPAPRAVAPSPAAPIAAAPPPAAPIAPAPPAPKTEAFPAAAMAAQSSARAEVSVLADPFAAPAPKPVAPAAPPASAVRPVVELDLDEPVRVKRSHGPPAMAYAFIAMAAVFGGVAAWVLLSKPQQIIVVQQSAPVASTTAASADKAAPTAQVEVGEPTPEGSAGPVAKTALGRGGPLPKASATTSAAPLDTSGFTSPIPGPVATAPPGSQGGTAGGQLSAGEVQGVVASNTPRVRRKCWQPALDSKSPSAPTSARVNGSITIGPSGNVDSVSASGSEKDFPGLSSCIAASMKSWKFPASGGSSTFAVPFVFAGQGG